MISIILVFILSFFNEVNILDIEETNNLKLKKEYKLILKEEKKLIHKLQMFENSYKINNYVFYMDKK